MQLQHVIVLYNNCYYRYLSKRIFSYIVTRHNHLYSVFRSFICTRNGRMPAGSLDSLISEHNEHNCSNQDQYNHRQHPNNETNIMVSFFISRVFQWNFYSATVEIAGREFDFVSLEGIFLLSGFWG